MNLAGDLFSPDDLKRIEAETFVRSLECYRELPSTNDLALELATRDEVILPMLVIAESQTAGRGRGGNLWWSMSGALTFSLVLDTTACGLPKNCWPQASLTAGLSVCEALENLRPDLKCGLKWPNDVYIRWRKICGVLVEVPQSSNNRLVIGVGINVNNSLTAAPQEIQAIATSLHDETQQHFDLADILIEVLRYLALWLDLVGSGSGELSQAWQHRCILRGRTIHLDLGAKRVAGICRGIDTDGALMLQTDAGLQRFYTGAVARIE
ncbi:MAG: biotin--[acetyl-CoA-carboxylase] ligase [Planctomycetes bacterium]|nr:biotin--[acetyl-CoA-carboxylase] ligase [Planctomycetota bacterium]